MRSTTRGSRSLRSFFALGPISGETEEVRAFLQSRLALFGLVLFALTGVSYGIHVVGDLAVARLPLARLADPAFVLHLVLVVTSGLLWAWVRAGRRSSAALHVFDALVMALMTAVLAGMLVYTPTSWRPDMTVLFGMTHVLVARAALVPSTGTRTAVTALATTLLLVAVAGLHFARSPLPEFSTANLVVFLSMWVVMATVSTTVTSRVIYGLHQQVREAMRLGQYTLEEKIGEGGMGVVYRARHALLRRPTAVKLLAPDRRDDVALARFEREVRQTSRLSHPNTIAIYDYGRTPEGVFYYAMEFLEGVDLDTLVRGDGPQPPGRVVHVLRQAAGALGEAHRAGLVHRDIKPGNLMLCERGGIFDFVKVLDFGLVKEISASADAELTASNTLTGTPLYMAPEAIDRRTEPDARSDLYALGAVAYLLLTGAPPFEGQNALDVASQHLLKDPEPPSRRAPVPASLDAVVLRCLEKDPSRRFESAQALVAALDACSDIGPWTPDHAAAWWRDRGDRLSRSRATAHPSERALPVHMDPARLG